MYWNQWYSFHSFVVHQKFIISTESLERGKGGERRSWRFLLFIFRASSICCYFFLVSFTQVSCCRPASNFVSNSLSIMYLPRQFSNSNQIAFFSPATFVRYFISTLYYRFVYVLPVGSFLQIFFLFFNIPNEKQQALIKTISPCHSLVICPRPIKLKLMIDVHVRNPSVIRQCFNQVRRWKFHDNKEKLKSWFNSNRIRNLLSGFLDPKNK